MSDKLRFELLAVDHSNNATSGDANGLLYALRSLTDIWSKPNIDEANCQIDDGETLLKVSAVEAPKPVAEPPFGRAYLIGLAGTFCDVEPMREPLTAYLKERQQFDPLYVVRDDISREIACELYPLLYGIENQLRGYLIKFMTIQLGPGWWKQTAPREVDDKARMRKKNEKIFGRHIDNFTYLTDFGELGSLVYKQTSGFLTREDIVAKIGNIPETPEAIKKLKSELQTNYQKFFRESFADRDFKDRWNRFEFLRNKIAHNNLFTADDLDSGKQLHEELQDIIEDADKKTTTLVISHREREALQDTVGEAGGPGKKITETELLEQLSSQQQQFEETGGFVGITRFIRGHLLNQGYEPQHCYRLVEELDESGKIEVYHVENPHSDFKTAALRISAQMNAREPRITRL